MLRYHRHGSSDSDAQALPVNKYYALDFCERGPSAGNPEMIRAILPQPSSYSPRQRKPRSPPQEATTSITSQGALSSWKTRTVMARTVHRAKQ